LLNKKQGYDELVQELSEMTQHHCCDAYHKGKRIPHSIEQELQGLYKTGFKQGTT